jgi:hypothetical protein
MDRQSHRDLERGRLVRTRTGALYQVVFVRQPQPHFRKVRDGRLYGASRALKAENVEAVRCHFCTEPATAWETIKDIDEVPLCRSHADYQLQPAGCVICAIDHEHEHLHVPPGVLS